MACPGNVNDGSGRELRGGSEAGDIGAAYVTDVEKVSQTVKVTDGQTWRLATRFNPSDLRANPGTTNAPVGLGPCG